MKFYEQLYRRTALRLLTVGMAALFAAPFANVRADDDDDDDGKRKWRHHQKAGNIVQVLEKDGRFTILLTALDLAGLKDAVATGGPFTLFAPTDEAFAALPPGVLDGLVQDTNALQQVLLYHVLSGKEKTADLIAQSTAVTLEGDPVLVLKSKAGVTVNGQTVINADKRASNGIIHVLGGVLVPSQEELSIESMVDVLKLDGRFNILLAAVGAAGLSDALATSPSLTLFAPTDEAFGKLPAGTVEALLQDTNTLAQILLYHVLGQSQDARHLLAAGSATTLQGEEVTVTAKDKMVMVNDSGVINANVNTPNGFVHVIDTVLLPPVQPETVLDLLKEDGRFTTLLTALELTGLDEALSGQDLLTLFAPTDEAFAKLPSRVLDYLVKNTDALTQVLLYHVVAGEQTASDLLKERRVETLQGGRVFVFHWKGKVYVNRAQVVDANLEAGNGLVHAIDSVLLPLPKH